VQPIGDQGFRAPQLSRTPVLHVRAAALILLTVLLVACTSKATTQNQQRARLRALHAVRAQRVEPPSEYILYPGDVVAVKFFYHPQLNEQLPIRPDGKITLQLVGDVQAAGRSLPELRAALREHYSPLLSRPEVAVMVIAVDSQRVYVGGEVTSPGAFPIVAGMTAMQAILTAGGQLKTAELRNVVILRDQGTHTPIVLLIDLQQGLQKLGQNRDVVVEPRDIVFVPKTKIAEANQFVEQYVDKLIPISRAFNLQYNLGALSVSP